MNKLIVANWKMNPPSDEEAEKLLGALAKISVPVGVEAVICPPLPYLADAKRELTNFGLGAQDVYWTDDDAITGGISPLMLKNMGVKYVIVGHSEHREKLHETNVDVARKTGALLKDGLIPIVCVGEPASVRELKGDGAEKFVLEELEASLPPRISGEIVVAYEPIWAISTSGSGKTDTPEDAVLILKAIRNLLISKFSISDPKVIYGGSVSSKNAKDFISNIHIDGALVGHASLNSGEFQDILNAAK